jgi:chemotaxis protein MotB
MRTRRSKRHEEPTDHDAWAIPYADLLTLLLAFFVVMYAVSSVNVGKYRVVSDSLSSAFRGAPTAEATSEPGRNPADSAAANPAREPSPEELAKAAELEQAKRLAAAAAARRAELEGIAGEVQRAMAPLIDAGQMIVRTTDDRVEIEMRADILFPSGSATLATDAVSAIDQLAAVLRTQPNPVRVEGHTDDLPIRTSLFASNWELSAARAATVVRLFTAAGVDPSRMAVLGLGEYRPIQSNLSPEGRTANRRVLVVILGSDAAPRALTS